MSRTRKRKHLPGDTFRCPETGDYVVMGDDGETRPMEFTPHTAFPDEREGPPAIADDLAPLRADGSISPFYALTQDELEARGQPSMRHDDRRPRHDGWTVDRQASFIETLAATASVSEACRYVGLSRQSAHKLYGRSAHFRAAWDEALKAAIGVLAATAFDRAVNGTQEQVWHQGEMIGFREKHHDRLLMYLLRVRDPLNYAPLDDLAGWARHRALESKAGDLAPVIDRLEAAERAWAAGTGPAALPAPEDQLEPAAAQLPAPGDPPTLSTLSTSQDDHQASSRSNPDDPPLLPLTPR